MDEKKLLRKEMLALRNGLDMTEKAENDEHICSEILQLIESLQPKAVHVYVPMGSEIDVVPVIQYLLSAGITVVAPKALKGRKMENLVLHSISEVEEGIYGTRHPTGNDVYTGEYDLFIIPGLAFDRQNYRLGYGAGYYDTFFQSHPSGYKLGICYTFQVVDKVPTEAHDVRLDKILF